MGASNNKDIKKINVYMCAITIASWNCPLIFNERKNT